MKIEQINVQWKIGSIDIGEERAIELADTEFWKDWPIEDIVLFQFNNIRLCVPWPTFHQAVEDILARPVYTYEFITPRLKQDTLLIANWMHNRRELAGMA